MYGRASRAADKLKGWPDAVEIVSVHGDDPGVQPCDGGWDVPRMRQLLDDGDDFVRRHRRQSAADPALLEQYAAAGGDTAALALLADLDQTRAAEIALRHLDNRELRWAIRANAAWVLGKLTGTGSIDAREALSRRRDGDVPDMTPYLLQARALTGDEQAIAELRRRAAADEGPTTRLARIALAQCGRRP